MDEQSFICGDISGIIEQMFLDSKTAVFTSESAGKSTEAYFNCEVSMYLLAVTYVNIAVTNQPIQYINVIIYLSSYWAQSFTSLKADLCQDINRGSAFSRCFNGTFP